MTTVLIATDSTGLADEVRSVLSSAEDTAVIVPSGAEVRRAVAAHSPSLAVLDLQIGNMGGIAACLDLRLEESGGRLDHVPVLLLLDRRADVFLARRAGAEGWLLKPLDPIRLRKAFRALLDGGTYEDGSYRPEPVLVARPS